jgi:hypothetical protein
MTGYTVYISYVLVPTGFTGGSYTQGVHCNYFKTVALSNVNPYIVELNMNFPNEDDFKYLTADITNGTGFTANEIHVLVQLIDNSVFSSVDDITPDSSAWKSYDVTDQITGYVAGQQLTGADLTSTVFKIPLLQYQDDNVFIPYNLDYLNYPSKEDTDDDKLCFGDEVYFLGNVTTEIKAIAYTTDISINLPLNEFNSSSNPTWDGDVDTGVYITEVGIYNENKELVAIGKLNNPILKDSTVARTIVFAMDF